MKNNEILDWLMLSAIEANYNMIRIWGGGMYLDDNFYELTDMLGILVWHDTMFSCKFYPMINDEFIKNV